MSENQIQQVSEAEVELQQQTEAEKEQTITELEKRLVQEAVTAIAETKKAISAIEKNDNEAAIKAIEQAVGELDVILARDPDLAVVPVDYAIAIVNNAPDDSKTIKDIRKEIKVAINTGDFPLARKLLNSLASEIRVIVSNLPLATYPEALKQAARLMDEGKTETARGVLQLALSTLVMAEEYMPIPILKARNLINKAEAETDKDKALQLLAEAQTQLHLSQELGYAEADAEYEELKSELKNLEKQLKSGENSQNAFAKLKNNLTGFFKRISLGQKKSS
ncbi:MAG: hypothetical protein D6756_11695 [Cyanobacteria bacterium J083]|nr:MAG: hypothetical protein D6756_11695 [Cyanobacteria bacterium J083]